MSLIQSFNGSMCNGNSVDASDTVGFVGFANYHNQGVESRSGVVPNNFSVGRLPSLVDPSNANGVIYGDMSSSEPEEAQFVINFKSGYNNLVNSCGSLLSFEQGEENHLKIHKNNEEYPIWGDHVMGQGCQWDQPNPNSSNESRSSEDVNCFETASSYGTMSNNAAIMDNNLGDEGFTWLYSEGGTTEEPRGAESNQHKRPHMGGEVQASKKQCLLGSRKTKPAKIIQSKDPQSVAAKNRRERISERLKILQDLVPNGAKVDLVSMLEKAISYVKFLQLQVKVLATDEFWPSQGGKAPEISQVKEAIDAILSSHKDRNSSSK